MHLVCPTATLPHRRWTDLITGIWAQSYDPQRLEAPSLIIEES